MIVFCLILIPCFAATTFDISSAGNTIVKLITNIANPTAVVCIGIALTRIVMTRDSKATEDAIRWIKGILITFIIFNILGSFLNWVEDFMTKPSYTYSAPGSLSETIKNEKRITEFY